MATVRHDTGDEDRALSRFVCDSVTEYAIFTVSSEGAILTWNPGAQRTFGYTRDEVIGRNFSIIFSFDDVADGIPTGELSGAAERGRIDRDGWHMRKDGSRFWGTNTVQPLLDDAGLQIGFTKIVRDSTERYNAALALRQSEERFRLLVDSVDHYAIFSAAPDGRITLWNAGAQRTFGYAPHEILGEHFGKLFTAEDAANGIPEVELRQARERGQIENERWQVRKDGSRFIAQRRLTLLKSDADDVEPGFSAVAHDVTARRADEQTMWDQAFHDTLTGLANRALFVEHLRGAIARTGRRPQRQFAVLFLDLDDFKTVNDEIGHMLADGVLVQVANRLRACVRPEDVVARLGGDEFTILLSEIRGAPDALALADRIHAALAASLSVGGRRVSVAASIGIAIGMHAPGAGAEDVLRDADIAMYEAKGRGRAQTVIFDDAMRARVASRHTLQTDVRRAIEREELFLEYQPIVALSDLRLVGFEALVRWQHPEHGVLPPGDFIPSAEETGSIIAIDRWVLRTACRQLSAWKTELPQAAGLTMSVNLSAKQFADDDLCETIARTLTSSHLEAGSLKLEITESTIMEKSDKVFSQLAEIRALDVDIQIDDFGTGYSSLSYLRMFPVSAVKVDRTFITGMDADEDRAQMVRAIVMLAHNLRLAVIAEGVETSEELDALRELSCECAQGFLFSAPLGAESARALIVRDREIAV
ncbi:MAG TPA: EAL domain-containing protein [Candidatus Elarobacter sp.]|nr:EAL domain-containing protein [Candidatus Elarobacter sp.]